jgi:hypothetical protein
MVKLKNTPQSFLISFSIVLVVHLIVLIFLKKATYHQFLLAAPRPPAHRIDKIDFISKEDLDRIKRVGITHGKKKLDQPDFIKQTQAQPLFPSPSSPPLAPQTQTQTQAQGVTQAPESQAQMPSSAKEEKVISLSNSHEVIKRDTLKGLSFNRDSVAAQKISNFEIRYERPEGVSENELNSDEKAFYSFYKRSYSSYVSKLYSTYDAVAITHPKIRKDFENQHLLVGRIDYDENGNIIAIKILKSSDSDDVHYFFEETLKKLILPNPPKIFVKKKKEFSIYYQVQVN